MPFFSKDPFAFLKTKKKTNGDVPSEATTSQLSNNSRPAERRPSQFTNDTGSNLIFSNSKNFNVGVFNYVENRAVSDSQWGKAWDMLAKIAAPSALHNSKDRFDPPKCDEDTRIEVNAEILGWIQDREAPQRLLCMTGSAGGGKSSIQQTIAEKCAELGILAASFFFSVADPTRNSVEPFVATIACQVALLSPSLREIILEEVEKDPLLFARSLQVQLDTLIVKPIRRHQLSSNVESSTLPYAILIDGLDECNDERRQAELLLAIDKCLLSSPDLPFRIFISSRPELPIHTALAENGHLHSLAYHLELSHMFDATADIRRYLWRRLRDIALRSGDTRVRLDEWPSKAIIDLLVLNASGQFVYAATVIKYVSDPRCSPVDRLNAVVGWTPGFAQRAKPFAALDALYHQILTIAQDSYRRIDGNEDSDLIVLLRVAVHAGTLCRVFLGKDMPEVMGLADGRFGTLVCDLRSLIRVDDVGDYGQTLTFYHKSCEDFLRDPSRGGDFFVSDSRVCLHFARCILTYIEKHATPAATRRDVGPRAPLRDEQPNRLQGTLMRPCLTFVFYQMLSFNEKNGDDEFRAEVVDLIRRWVDLDSSPVEKVFVALPGHWLANEMNHILNFLTEVNELELAKTILAGCLPTVLRAKAVPNPDDLLKFG